MFEEGEGDAQSGYGYGYDGRGIIERLLHIRYEKLVWAAWVGLGVVRTVESKVLGEPTADRRIRENEGAAGPGCPAPASSAEPGTLPAPAAGWSAPSAGSKPVSGPDGTGRANRVLRGCLCVFSYIMEYCADPGRGE